MHYRDLDLHSDENVYGNSEMFTARRELKTDVDEIELQTTEEQYDQIGTVNRQSDNIKVTTENRGKAVQWEEQPRWIKVIIYTLSVAVVLLLINFVIVSVIVYTPKGEADGSWTLWSSWSKCDVTCDNGTKTRMRLCYNPSVTSELFDCEGNSTELKQCRNYPCVEGAWSNWESWGSCSESCGGGVKSRLRTCSSSMQGCEGSSEQVMLCNKNTCDDQKVSFLAYGSEFGATKSVIRFATVLLNSGNHYNSSTGKFTCKTPGIYHFAVTLTKKYQLISYINAYLRINETNKLYFVTQLPSSYYNNYESFPLTISGNFHLNINDYVYVSGDSSYFMNDKSSFFTGVLVIPDD